MSKFHKIGDVLDKMLDEESEAMFGRKYSDCLVAQICLNCGESATDFPDQKGVKMYRITGLCAKCQNGYYKHTGGKDETS